MADQVILKNSFSVALLTLMQTLLPALITVTSLLTLASMLEVPVTEPMVAMAVFSGVLAMILLPAIRSMSLQLVASRVPLVFAVVVRWLILLSILFAIGYATRSSQEFARRLILTWAVVTPPFLIASALLLQEWLRRIVYSPENSRSVVFAGCNEVSLQLADRLKTNLDNCMSVAGFFDDRSASRLGVTEAIQLSGKLSDMTEFVKKHHIDVVFIALPMRQVQRVLDLLDELRDTTVSIYYVPDVFVFDLVQARMGEVGGFPVVAMCETPFYGYRGIAKRVSDLVLATLITIGILPLLAVIALLVWLTSHGPVVFRQRRYGLDGHEIIVYKFRTMTVTEDGAVIRQASLEDARITGLGRFLRRYSLDELPQLINVLQGRMSLVGPRPHAIAHNEMYRKLIKGYMSRHKVLPGITGLAQVNGFRGETKNVEQMEARVRYDLEYLRNWSVFLDLKILALTVVRMLKDDKAY